MGSLSLSGKPQACHDPEETAAVQVSLALPSRKLRDEWGSQNIKAITPQIKAELQVGQRPPGKSAQPPAEDQGGGGGA